MSTVSLICLVSEGPEEGSELARDSVCNMEVEERTAKWKSEYKAKTYYFCSPICKQQFERNPEKFVKP